MTLFRTLGALASSAFSPSGRQALVLAPAVLSIQSRFMSGCKLFVGGLAWETDDTSLRDAFSTFGDVSEAKVIMDRVTGRSRGFGFVLFNSEEDAQNALTGMDGKFLGGRTIRVDFAQQKEAGMRPGPGGGNGSPRSRSFGQNDGGSYGNSDYSRSRPSSNDRYDNY